MGYRGKRALDLLIAVPALVLLSPVMAVIALLVARDLGRPVLFRQVRPGLNGQPFTMYKFRTMRDARDDQGRPLPDAERLTPLGRLLRATSLDELPEFINVVRGEMSVVGPRPLLMKYLPYFRESEMVRFSIRPGITGWAQIHGRNELAWDARLAYDIWYVGHVSLALDLRIIGFTLMRVLRRENVQVAPQVTMRDLDEERSELAR